MKTIENIITELNSSVALGLSKLNPLVNENGPNDQSQFLDTRPIRQMMPDLELLFAGTQPIIEGRFQAESVDSSTNFGTLFPKRKYSLYFHSLNEMFVDLEEDNSFRFARLNTWKLNIPKNQELPNYLYGFGRRSLTSELKLRFGDNPFTYIDSSKTMPEAVEELDQKYSSLQTTYSISYPITATAPQTKRALNGVSYTTRVDRYPDFFTTSTNIDLRLQGSTKVMAEKSFQDLCRHGSNCVRVSSTAEINDSAVTPASESHRQLSEAVDVLPNIFRNIIFSSNTSKKSEKISRIGAINNQIVQFFK